MSASLPRPRGFEFWNAIVSGVEICAAKSLIFRGYLGGTLSEKVKSFFEDLRRLMAMLSVTRTDLAEKSGISESTLSKVIAGETKLTIDRAELLASALGADLTVALELPHEYGSRQERATFGSVRLTEHKERLAARIEQFRQDETTHRSAHVHDLLSVDEAHLSLALFNLLSRTLAGPVPAPWVEEVIEVSLEPWSLEMVIDDGILCRLGNRYIIGPSGYLLLCKEYARPEPNAAFGWTPHFLPEVKDEDAVSAHRLDGKLSVCLYDVEPLLEYDPLRSKAKRRMPEGSVPRAQRVGAWTGVLNAASASAVEELPLISRDGFVWCVLEGSVAGARSQLRDRASELARRWRANENAEVVSVLSAHLAVDIHEVNATARVRSRIEQFAACIGYWQQTLSERWGWLKARLGATRRK